MKSNTNSAVRKFIYKESTVGYVFALPFIIGFLGFTLIPIVSSLYYSFTDYNLIQKESWIGTSNYFRLFQDDRFWMSLKVTMKYVIISVPSKLCFALLVAMLLTRKTKLTGFYRSLFYVPSLIGGSIAVALVWKELFSRNGLINQTLGIVDIKPVSWFGDQRMAMIPLILMTVWQFGSSMIIFAAGLKEIPGTYYEAAKIDGANWLYIFRKITLPLLMPVTFYLVVTGVIGGAQMYVEPRLVFTVNGPANSTFTTVMHLYDYTFTNSKAGYGSAVSLVLGFIVFIVTALQFYINKKGEQ